MMGDDTIAPIYFGKTQIGPETFTAIYYITGVQAGVMMDGLSSGHFGANFTGRRILAVQQAGIPCSNA